MFEVGWQSLARFSPADRLNRPAKRTELLEFFDRRPVMPTSMTGLSCYGSSSDSRRSAPLAILRLMPSALDAEPQDLCSFLLHSVSGAQICNFTLAVFQSEFLRSEK
jgi:hypothetical protein